MTGGEKGAAYDIRGQCGFVPCFRTCNIVETTGAGDAFSAGYIAKCIRLMSNSNGEVAEGGGLEDVGLYSGGEMARELVRFGSAVGALTCGGEGAILPQPSVSQVLDLLSREEPLVV